jgi:hypothetical protein
MHNKINEMEIVREPEKIRELYNSCFSGKTVFMKYFNNDIRVKCHGYSVGHVVIAIPYIKSIPDPVVIFSFDDNNIIHLNLKKTAAIQQDLFQFAITRCYLVPSSRNQNRSTIELTSANKNIIYITNLITETMINNSLIISHNKINAIFSYAEKKMREKFLFVKMTTAMEIPHDPRMQYIYTNNEGYIVSRLGKHVFKKTPAYEYYMNYIYPGERTIKTGMYRISEAIFPISYKGKIPYGYLRINKETEFSENDITMAENLIKSIEKHFYKIDVFPVIKEKILVQDISSGGFSTLQNQKKNARIFKNGNLVCCDMVLPGRGEINILGKITYNKNKENGLIRSGMKIEKISAEEKSTLMHYLESSRQII